MGYPRYSQDSANSAGFTARSDMVAEMVIGHGRKGIQRVYDQHSYEDEMREALELWAARLRDIVTPPPENVVRLRKERA